MGGQKSIQSIWSEFLAVQEPLEPLDCNSDVLFELDDGSQWCASFFTYRNIETLRKKNQSTGECLHGTYFCASEMILISEMSEEVILQVLQELLARGEMEIYCRRLS